jgi:hypothetical protein
MDTAFQHLVPAEFADDSRVWIYQSSRLFGMGEALSMEPMLEEFVQNWKSHGVPVKGYANLFFGRFIVIMADETATGVSGCSTDSSVRLIKQIESLFKVDMFNRQQLAFVVKDKIEILPMAQVSYAVENGFITPETLYFNNLVATKKEWLTKWLLPVKHSWLAQKLPGIVNAR